MYCGSPRNGLFYDSLPTGKTMEITEVVGYRNGEILLNPLYQFVEDADTSIQHVSGHLQRTGNKLQNDFKLKLMGYQGEW